MFVHFILFVFNNHTVFPVLQAQFLLDYLPFIRDVCRLEARRKAQLELSLADSASAAPFGVQKRRLRARRR